MSFDLKGRGRMIFALVGGMVFMFLQALFPDLPFTEEQTVMFVGLIGAYIIGEGISGRTFNDNLNTIIKSHKFQALIVGMFVNLIKGFFPDFAMSDAELNSFIASLMAFIIASGAQKSLPPQPESQITEGSSEEK